MNENLAIIPARGGSKGIPKKNIVDICGRPLIEYTIDAALAANTVNRLIVSTDDVDIANVSSKAGAEVIMRPDDISGDFASSESALIHVLEVLNENEEYRPDIVTFLQCTSPLTTPEDIDGTVCLVDTGEADTSFSAIPFHYYLWSLDDNGNAEGINHVKSKRVMRQELDPQFLETGSVYVMRVRQFLEYQHRFFGRTRLFLIPEENYLEIDEPADLDIATAIISRRIST